MGNDEEDKEPETIFPNVDIALEHHEVSHVPVTGDPQEIMLHLTSEGVSDIILEQLPWVQENIDLISTSAFALHNAGRSL